MQQKLRTDIYILTCCFILLVVLIQPWNLYYLNDDFMHIPNQCILLCSGFFRPIPNISIVTDTWLYGTNALGFLTTNLFLQILSGISVYILIQKIQVLYIRDLSLPRLPLIASILFIFYPYHAESIMWVLARASTTATVFILFSYYFYLDGAKYLWRTGLSWSFFILALLSYESIWNAPLFFTLFSFLNIRLGYTSIKQETRGWTLMMLSFILYIILRIVLLGTVGGDGYLEINENLSKYSLLVINIIKLTGRNFTPPFQSSAYAIVFFIFSVVFFLWLLYKLFKANRTAFYTALICAAGMVSAIVTAAPLGINTHTNEGERYLYYSSFFFCVFIAVAILQLISTKWQYIATGVITLLFIILLADLQHNYAYSSMVTRTTVETVGKYPNYQRAYFIDVPERYKGSLMFRISLPNAIRWLDPHCTYDSIILLSKNKEVKEPAKFMTGEITWLQLKQEKGWIDNIVMDSSGNKHQLSPKEDVLFYYKNDGIYKVNLFDSIRQKTGMK